MTKKDLLDGKSILIVDDEPDVLETLEEFLSMCDVTKATKFEAAKNLLETQNFDLAFWISWGLRVTRCWRWPRKKRSPLSC